MKLLVSDYDGTIYFKDDVEYTNTNLNAINELLKTNNKFCIATGRSFKSIKEQIDRFSIRYDYLITNNGNIVFDDKNNLISFKLLDKCLVRELVYALRKLSNINNIILYDMYGNETNNFFEVVEIVIGFNKRFDINELNDLKDLLKFLTYRMHYHKCYFKDDTIKSDGIKFISDTYKIPKKNIYTIGDDVNDKDMINNYNGFIIPESYINNGSLNNPTLKLHELIKEKIL